jgi:hypothetical protein
LIKGHRASADQDGKPYDDEKAKKEWEYFKGFWRAKSVGALFTGPLLLLIGVVQFRDSFVLEQLTPIAMFFLSVSLFVLAGFRNWRLRKLAPGSSILLAAGTLTFLGFILIYL